MEEGREKREDSPLPSSFIISFLFQTDRQTQLAVIFPFIVVMSVIPDEPRCQVLILCLFLVSRTTSIGMEFLSTAKSMCDKKCKKKYSPLALQSILIQCASMKAEQARSKRQEESGEEREESSNSSPDLRWSSQRKENE